MRKLKWGERHKYLARIESSIGQDEFKSRLINWSDKEISKMVYAICGTMVRKNIIYMWRKDYGVKNWVSTAPENRPPVEQIIQEYQEGATCKQLVAKYRMSTISLKKILGDNVRKRGGNNAKVFCKNNG